MEIPLLLQPSSGLLAEPVYPANPFNRMVSDISQHVNAFNLQAGRNLETDSLDATHPLWSGKETPAEKIVRLYNRTDTPYVKEDDINTHALSAWQASTPSFTSKFKSSLEINLERTACGLLGNRCYTLPTPGLITNVGSWFNKRTDGAKTYFNILGIDPKLLSVGPQKDYETYRQFFFTKAGRSDWSDKIKQSFADFLNPAYRKGMTAYSFVKDTLIKRNLKTVFQDWANGNICSAALKSFGLTSAGISIVRNTKRAHEYAQSKEDGSLKSRLKTIGYTAAHAIGQTLKTGVCWEAGTLGLTIGSALCPIGIAANVAGIIGAALLGTITYKGLSFIIPDPPQLSA